jgi:hypothetical protein
MNDRILFPRVQGILEAVPRFFPGYADDPTFRELADFQKLKEKMREKVWFGYRPLSADGVPYIGFAKKNEEPDDRHRTCYAWTEFCCRDWEIGGGNGGWEGYEYWGGGRLIRGGIEFS